jgi:hypothetical protein
VHPSGKSKKIYFARGILKDFFAGVKQNTPTLQGVNAILPNFFLFALSISHKLKK